jgi:hypothetical protein
MLNPFPCIIWPLAMIGAFGAYRMWRRRQGQKGSLLVSLSAYIGFLLVLWWVVLVIFGRFWADGLFSFYIPQ